MTVVDADALGRFSLHFYTSVNLRAGQMVELVDAIKAHFLVERLPAVLCFDVDGKPVERSVRDLAGYVGSPAFDEWRGRLNVFVKAEGIAGRWELLRLPVGSEDRRSGLDLNGRLGRFASHEIVVEMDAGLRRDGRVVDGIFSLFARVSDVLQATFALGQDVEPSYLKNLHSPRGLAAGLPDVFRLTTFGPEFVAIVGAEKLLRLPVYRAAQLSSGAVAIQTDAAIARRVNVEATRGALKSAIGGEYFIASDDGDGRPDDVGGGRVGLLHLASFLWRQWRAQRDTRHLARRRPVIDSSGLFVQDARDVRRG